MADGSSTLARIQGRGLVETTTRDVEMPATTPGGAIEQGRPPDSAKMAGTQPAKVNALRVAMQDVGSRRLGAIREMAKPDLAADQRVQGVRQKASVLGRLDETMAVYINQQLQKQFAAALLPSGASLKEGVYKGKEAERTTLNNTIAKIITNDPNKPVTDADIKIVNDALASVGAGAIKLTKETSPQINAQLIASSLFDNMTPDQMSKAFGEAVTLANQNTNLKAFLDQPEADTFAAAQGLTDSDELTSLLKSILPQGADLTTMRLGDVTAAIQQWRQEEFKDVTQYQETLVDPTASPAQRQLALENLRRLGKVGVLALDQKVGDLDAQMQDGDTVTIDNQSFEISEFFEKPESLAQLKGWLDKPDTAPASLKGWIEANRDAIKNKVNELSPDLQALSNKVEENLKSLEINKNWKPADLILKEFFDDLTEPSLDNRFAALPADAQAKFKVLQDSNTGPIISQLLTALSKNSIQLSDTEFTLSGTGLKGIDIYNQLTAADLQQIAKTGVKPFMANIIAQKHAKDFVAMPTNIETAGGEIFQFLESIGIPDTGSSFSRLAGNKNLAEFQDIFNQAGLGNLVVNGQFNIQGLKDKIKELGLTTETKPSANILNGSNLKTMREYFSTTLGKLRTAIATPSLKTLGTTSQLEAEFSKTKEAGPYSEPVSARRTRLQRESADANAQFNLAKDEKKYLEANEPRDPIFGLKEKGWSEWDGRMRRANGDYNATKARLEQVNSELSNIPNYEAKRQEAYKSWFENYQNTLNQTNQGIIEKYTKLGNIIGGLT